MIRGREKKIKILLFSVLAGAGERKNPTLARVRITDV
jgi:hypothetical protein